MKVVIVLMLTFLIFIVSCTSGLTGSTVIDPNDKCSSLEGSVKDDCYLQGMKCSKISSDSVRNICVSKLALQKGDSKICDLITAENIKGNCLFSISKESNNLEICVTIDDKYWRDICHFTYATVNNKEVFCSAINSGEQQSSCFYDIALETGKVHLCEMMLDKDIELCIYQVAQKEKNIEYCDLLSKGIPSNSCRLKLASQILQDESLCDLIKLSELRDICHERFE